MARRARPRWGTAVVALMLVAGLVVAAIAIEVSLPARAAPSADPVAVEPPSSGTWYCPVTAAAEETAVVSIAAATEQDSTVTIVRYSEGRPIPDEPVEVTPGAQLEVVLSEGAAASPVAVRWSGGPVVTSWRVEGPDTAGATCAPNPAATWHVSGFDTSAQSRSTLHLFNPFGVAAAARVTFGTPTGAVALVLTDNISVPPGSSVALNLNDFEPEQPDLALNVEVLAGRLVAQGAVAFAPTANQPGPTGRVVLPASTAPALRSYFADARSGEQARTWISILNPGEREAAVELRVSDPLPESPVLLGETSVPAGGVVRLEVADTSSAPSFGVAVLGVNDVPVVATRLTSVATGEAEGLSAALGTQPSSAWAAAGGGGGDRRSVVAVYNPGAEAVTVDVDAGEGTPGDWSGVEVGANARVELPLAEVAESPGIPVRVSSEGTVVMAVTTSSAGENLRYWTAGGIPEGVWTGPGTRPPVHRDPALATQPLPGTTDDPQEAGPLPAATPVPTTTPTTGPTTSPTPVPAPTATQTTPTPTPAEA